MLEKGLYSPTLRRILLGCLLAVVAGAFVGIYYFVFLPRQQNLFNAHTFRILHETVDNFSIRVNSYARANAARTENLPDESLLAGNVNPFDSSLFIAQLNQSFKGKPFEVTRSQSFIFRNDSIVYDPADTGKQKSRWLGDIIEPLVAVHSSTFDAIMLVRQVRQFNNAKRYDSILYKTSGARINNIRTDSILSSGYVETPAITQLSIENKKYRMFMAPFKLGADGQVYVLCGLMDEDYYRQRSNVIPIDFLLGIGGLFLLLVLALPFLKIFILSVQENISLADVRLLIVVIFTIPFVAALGFSLAWLANYPLNYKRDTLQMLEREVESRFVSEIEKTIRQAKHYDSLMVAGPKVPVIKKGLNLYYIDSSGKSYDTVKVGENTDLKNLLFYPDIHQNIENVHWMDASGVDLAAWNFTRKTPSYFNLSDRKYFTDIRDGTGYKLLNDTFSLLPTLSKITGDYTVTISIPSKAVFARGKAVALGISAKMNSIYNTVVPAGYGFCIIDKTGLVYCHSDTARNLQENFFDETNDNSAILKAINDKDSAYISNVQLYDQPVKMIIKPMNGLPLYLVSFGRTRTENLFLLHIGSFVFVCQAVLFLFASLFSYCIMMTERRLTKLFYIPEVLEWLKPSQTKRKYYVRNIFQVSATILSIFIASLFFSGTAYQLFMLNITVLLPLFAVSGYYIIKRERSHLLVFSINRNKKTSKFIKYLKLAWHSRNVLGLYLVSVIFYAILQNMLFYLPGNEGNLKVKVAIWTLIVIIPFITLLISDLNISALNGKIDKIGILRKVRSRSPQIDYLNLFLTSLLLFVVCISVLPTIAFTSYALNEEQKLFHQSSQFHYAKNIQLRREVINRKVKQTRLYLLPVKEKQFADQLKFSEDFGLYLNGNALDTVDFNSAGARPHLPGSPFYAHLKQYLFLPPDHVEFYDNQSHVNFYFWNFTFKDFGHGALQLFYRNDTDHANDASISLHKNIATPHIYSGILQSREGYLLLLLATICCIIFYRVVYSVARRVFLVDYFKNSPATSVHLAYLAEVRRKESDNNSLQQEHIISNHSTMLKYYEKIWSDCDNEEKYTLYDFALDGFTNYKKTFVLYRLYQKGLIVKEDDNITLMSKSFRNFLITKNKSQEVRMQSAQGRGSWFAIRTVFYIILIAVAIFLFISQEEASKRLIAVVTSLGALLPAILKLFDTSTTPQQPSKSN